MKELVGLEHKVKTFVYYNSSNLWGCTNILSGKSEGNRLFGSNIKIKELVKLTHKFTLKKYLEYLKKTIGWFAKKHKEGIYNV